MGILPFMSIIAYILIPSLTVSIAVDFITPSQSISDGMTLVSRGGAFELGFFSPGKSEKRYLGIWYKNIPIQTVVWVANRLNPINDSSGILTLISSGSLVLLQNDTVVWNTTSEKIALNPVAQLLESGNLVVRDEKETYPEDYLWQSFDYPSDTLLPGMKLGWDLKKGKNWTLTAWKSPDDPAPGDFSYVADHNNYPDFSLMKGDERFSRLGPWNGLSTSGSPGTRCYYVELIDYEDELYHHYLRVSASSRIVINQTTYSHLCFVLGTDAIWGVLSTEPKDYCDTYGICGANGNCNINETPVCQCLKGFSPKSPEAWKSMDWYLGCVRNKPLNCTNTHKDGFVKLQGLKVPDTTRSWLDETIGLEQCKEKCLNNCSCTAYANSDIRGQGSGCAMWFGDLLDIRQFVAGGQDLYVRMATPEAVNHEEMEYGHRKKLRILVGTTIAAISGMLLVGCYYIYGVRRKMTDKSKNKEDQNNEGSEDDLDLPLLDLATIAAATNNFSPENKIGQGGFGPVYRGKLINGKEIAVKRLSVSSRQGSTEFRNEVILIAKLQHRNLVKLLGYCIQGQEKMLIYEYMPNGSLDSFIFGTDLRNKIY